MPQPQKTEHKYALRFMVLGLSTLGLVLLTCPAGLKPVFDVATSSFWQKLGDWPAAWCSFKIMLLSTSGLFLTIAMQEMLVAFNRSLLAKLFLILFILPVLGILAGFYYLIKSVF